MCYSTINIISMNFPKFHFISEGFGAFLSIHFYIDFAKNSKTVNARVEWVLTSYIDASKMTTDEWWQICYILAPESMSLVNNYIMPWNKCQWGVWNFCEFFKISPWIFHKIAHIFKTLLQTVHFYRELGWSILTIKLTQHRQQCYLILQLFSKQQVLLSYALAWQARTISIWRATNNDANTSENDSTFSFISFWHNSSLNTNKQTSIIHDDNKRTQAARRFPSRSVRTNTIIQKYASRASAVYNGIKIFHHDIAVAPSSRSARSTLNTSRPIKWSQISNTESPSHRTTSSSVRNMLGYIKTKMCYCWN